MAIARTGWMLYAEGETPISAGPDGYAMVHRDADALFADTALLSITGKPVTINHPRGGVGPHNSRQVTVGSLMNVRRGTGDESDVILADLLLTDAEAISLVESNSMREVSLGYETDYERTGVGLGKQTNIIGNHLALVGKGRCGPRCAIGDRLPSLPPKGKSLMGKQASGGKPRHVASPEARAAFLAAAAVDAEALFDEQQVEEPGVHVHLHGRQADAASTADEAVVALETKVDAGFANIKTTLDALLAKVGVAPTIAAPATVVPATVAADAAVTDAEGTGASGDSKALETGFRALVADAEVIAPGFAGVPAFDATAARKVTVDAMCGTRRLALSTAAATADGKAMLSSMTGGTFAAAALVTMDCGEVANLFRTVAAARKMVNRAATGDGRMPRTEAGTPINPPKGVMTVAEINAMNAKHYGRPQAS